MKNSKRARVQQERITFKIKDYEVDMPEKYADKAFYTLWAALAVWGLYVIPAIIQALK
jgi:hypothetical protein